MNKIFIKIIVSIIKGYKFLISRIFADRCRYLPTCSDYMIGALKTDGILKGSFLGCKRILTCHPFKFLGGGSGLNLVPEKKENKYG